MSLVCNNSKNVTWKTLGTFQPIEIHCQRIIRTSQCRNTKVGLIVQNSLHGYVKFNHRVCKIHRFPASTLNKVILLMTSRTNNNTFLFLFHFMHLHPTGCLFFKHPIALFYLFNQYQSQMVHGLAQNPILFVPSTMTFSTAVLAAIDSEIPVITESFLLI